jgi:hypothetical protein
VAFNRFLFSLIFKRSILESHFFLFFLCVDWEKGDR